eukprot:TRINITY_DN1895_c0_g1_i1.p1 TRINITY_DN1895_c0_g1~~TRINITY_DN1895_c0_g1_i1.p1  ORF type:complete len:356 (-),score=101.59 TRINITY_DN1895_c0_g1_i1:139-1206(-)
MCIRDRYMGWYQRRVHGEIIYTQKQNSKQRRIGQQQPRKMSESRVVRVYDLPQPYDESELRSLFEKAGKVVNIIPKGADVLVEYSNSKECEYALIYNEFPFGNDMKLIKVEVYKGAEHEFETIDHESADVSNTTAASSIQPSFPTDEKVAAASPEPVTKVSEPAESAPEPAKTEEVPELAAAETTIRKEKKTEDTGMKFAKPPPPVDKAPEHPPKHTEQHAPTSQSPSKLNLDKVKATSDPSAATPRTLDLKATLRTMQEVNLPERAKLNPKDPFNVVLDKTFVVMISTLSVLIMLYGTCKQELKMIHYRYVSTPHGDNEIANNKRWNSERQSFIMFQLCFTLDLNVFQVMCVCK